MRQPVSFGARCPAFDLSLLGICGTRTLATPPSIFRQSASERCPKSDTPCLVRVVKEVSLSATRLSISAVTLALGLGIAGCTPTSNGSTPPATQAPSSSSPSSPAPSPTPSWSKGQAAAIAAVDGYSDVSLRIGTDPSKFTEAQMTAEFKKYLGPDMLKANVATFMRMRKKGWHYEGGVTVRSLAATKVVDNYNARGLEVHVTACRDQTQRRIVDKAGNLADTQQPPKFNLRQFSVRRPAGSTVWRVYGITTVEGKCGS